jgi:hypothetical protein
MVTMLALAHSLSDIHGFFNGMKDFRMAVKILMTTNAVDNQQPFEHMTQPKQTDRLTPQLMMEELEISRDTIHKILLEDLC